MSRHILISYDNPRTGTVFHHLSSFPDAWTDEGLEKYALAVLDWRLSWYKSENYSWRIVTEGEELSSLLEARAERFRLQQISLKNGPKRKSSSGSKTDSDE